MSRLPARILVMLFCFATAFAHAATLTIDVGGKRTLSTEQLLARPDAKTIEVPNDVVFHRTMTYRAVPLRALLGVTRLPDNEEVQIAASDGFVTHLPAALLFGDATPHAEPWLAIEPPDARVLAASPVRQEQAVFAAQCLACHKLNGAGDASMGPDLNLPHNPTEYFQPWTLKQFIRDPKSIRAWPAMQMHGFDRSMLSDADIDAMIAYIGHMVKRRP